MNSEKVNYYGWHFPTTTIKTNEVDFEDRIKSKSRMGFLKLINYRRLSKTSNASTFLSGAIKEGAF